MEIILNQRSFTITPNHIYDDSFWNKFSERKYESFTQLFMYENLSHDAQLFDIGAAAGSYALLALSLKSSVVAVEAVPSIFGALHRNIEYSRESKDNVVLVCAAVSGDSGEISAEDSLRSKVLSSIVFTDLESKGEINRVRLVDLFASYRDKKPECIIKMDIEGGEFELLSIFENVKLLSKEKALLHLSLHPGFMRPPMRLPQICRPVQRLMRTLLNSVDVLRLYRNVSGKCKIFCNGVRVDSSWRFLLLVLLRFYDFVLDFR